MNTKIYYIIAFAVMALIQAFVPVSMILHREGVLSEGVLYKFKCAPVDPNDPFRGKYVALAFEAERYEIQNSNFVKGDLVYLLLERDAADHAKVIDVQSHEFGSGDYISATVRGVGEDYINLELPFNRYYIEESKAKAAEDVYRKMALDAEAHVYVTKGSAVLKKLMIGNKSIEKAAEEYLKTKDSE